METRIGMMRSITRCAECKKRLYGILGKSGAIHYYEDNDARKEHKHAKDVKWDAEQTQEEAAFK